ncbi:MAG: BamA/OMP85 family outer membrane protein [Bacteroidota bacterium]
MKVEKNRQKNYHRLAIALVRVRMSSSISGIIAFVCILGIVNIDPVLAQAVSSPVPFLNTLFQSDSEPQEEVIWEIDFKGNHTFTDIVLSNIIASEEPNVLEKLRFWNFKPFQFDPVELQKDEIRIKRYYERRGFDLVSVRSEVELAKERKEWKKKITFYIQENAPLIIENIRWVFDGTSPEIEEMRADGRFERMAKRYAFSPQERFRRIHLPEAQGAIVKRLKKRGFAHADISVDQEVDTLSRSVNLTFKVAPGPVSYFDQISVVGEKSISKTFVLRETALRKGDKFSQEKLQEAQRQIFNHHLFQFATINIPDQPIDSTLDINVRIREHPLRSIQLSAGLGREEIVRGEANWIHRNVAKRGHQFEVGARASFIEQRLSMDYLFPYVFNTKSSVVIQPYGQHLLEPSFELIRGGINNSFIYRYSRDLTGSISYEFTTNREISEQSVISLPDSINTYDRSSFQVSGYYGRGLFQNEDGWVFQPFAEVSGLMGSNAFTYEKLSLDIRRYIPVNPTLTLAGRVNGGIIFAARKDTLPNSVRFYAGGTSSVRGWTRQQLGPKRPQFKDSGTFDSYIPTGGRLNVKFNVEMRQQLNEIIKGFGFALFLDGGQVWRYESAREKRPIQLGVGGGLRYNSPIGPVRIDLGYKLNPTDEDLNIYDNQDYGGSFDRYALHLSIGHAF